MASMFKHKKDKDQNKKDKKKDDAPPPVAAEPVASPKPEREEPPATPPKEEKTETKPKKEEKSKDEKTKKGGSAKKSREEKAPPKKKRQSYVPAKDVEEEDENVEIAALEAATPDPSDTETTYKDLYNLFPLEVYGAYDKLQNFARDLNTQIPLPEIVFMGEQGHGKSSILEAFIGHAFNVVGFGGATKRPLYFNMINNVECDEPKCTIKRDVALKEFDHDIEVPLEGLQNEIQRRNQNITEEPIFVLFEYKHCLNVTFIDTPGLLLKDESDEAEQIENIVLNIARPSHRILISVETCQQWTDMEMIQFTKRVDPDLSRTTFVYTKFHTFVCSLTQTRAVNKFLGSILTDVKTFFTTMPSQKVREKFKDGDKLKGKIYQSCRRDMNLLEQLQYDKRFEGNIGIHTLRKNVFEGIWHSYQDSIPRILKHLRAKKTDTDQRISDFNKQLSEFDTGRLRSIASNYVVEFLQVIDSLISGTSEGNPTVNGQTLEEEKMAQGDGDWVDMYNQPLRYEPDEYDIPYWETKLYGGQQFERLLAEFKAICEHTKISTVTLDDIATAAGINKLNNVPNLAWAASDLAAQKAQDAFKPLIEQLCDRAVYIVKKLVDLTDKILEQRKKKWTVAHNSAPTIDINDVEQYPYFTHHVKDLYYKFIDETAKICKSKCMDEFYNTRTIYWDLTEYPEEGLPMQRNDDEDTQTAVIKAAKQLFQTLRTRITKNVLLKFYNFFLVPMQSTLWSEIQGKVNCLSDGNLEQIFEVATTKGKLSDDGEKLKSILDKCNVQDAEFLQAATLFCHPSEKM